MNTYLITIVPTAGPSMEPTLHSIGDVLLVDCFSYLFRYPRYNEVVYSISPRNVDVGIVKRVRGVEGDSVRYKKSRNGRIMKTVVKKGQVWLEGDNPGDSRDSREYGAVPVSLVKARVIARIWPPTRWGFLKDRKERSGWVSDRFRGQPIK
eukprot:g3993.t1